MNCACGHSKEDHGGLALKGVGSCRDSNFCQCTEFIPADPDAERKERAADMDEPMTEEEYRADAEAHGGHFCGDLRPLLATLAAARARAESAERERDALRNSVRRMDAAYLERGRLLAAAESSLEEARGLMTTARAFAPEWLAARIDAFLAKGRGGGTMSECHGRVSHNSAVECPRCYSNTDAALKERAERAELSLASAQAEAARLREILPHLAQFGGPDYPEDLCFGCISRENGHPYEWCRKARELFSTPSPHATSGAVYLAARELAEALDKGYSVIDGLSGRSRPEAYCGKGQVEVRAALGRYRSALSAERGKK